MSYYPASIQNLIKHIARLPGIGEKTAERLALHILRAPRQEAQDLARSILDIKDKVKFCSKCFALADSELCNLCGDPARDASILCVVEQPADMVAIEKSGAFRGTYHVLSGALSPMNGIGPENIRIIDVPSMTTFRCFVNYYSSSINAESATVRVYDKDNTLLDTQTYTFSPNNAGAGSTYNIKSWLVGTYSISP